MRIAYLLLLQLLVSISALLAGQVGDVGGNRFPLMAWDYVDDPKVLESMRDCGINSVAFVRPKMLDACQKFGIKAIVFDDRLSGDLWSKPFNRRKCRFSTRLTWGISAMVH